MSFSSEVKDELLVSEGSAAAERAMGYGMLLFGRNFSKSEISLLTEHSATAEKYCSVISSFGCEAPEIITTDGGKFKISVTDRDSIKRIFSGLDVIGGSMLRRVNIGLLENTETCAAFIRGAFLSCGTVTDPEKEYHLEFTAPTLSLAKDIITVFSNVGEEISINPKITDRNGAHIVYLKKSEEIEDTLALMGASEKSLAVMGVKVLKDVRNTVNRRLNFESANMARTAQASAKQYEAIVKIRDAGMFDSLSDELKEIALLRLQQRELSSAEMCGMLSKPLSLSGVSHRLSKLVKIAEGIE